jgi:hypothetical protein
MLQQAGIARDQGGRGEAEYLPQGKIPWHDGQNDTERFVADATLPRPRIHDLVRQKGGSVLGVVAANPAALVDFGQCRGEGLTHLGGHQTREFFATGMQAVRRSQEPLRSPVDGPFREFLLCRNGALDNGLEIVVSEDRVLPQHLPRCRVHALHGHGGIGFLGLKLCAGGCRTYSRKITPNQPESPCCG